MSPSANGDGPDPPADDGSASEADPGGPLIVRERDTDDGLLVAVCDADVLGESFEEGEVSLTVTEAFYGGDAVDAEAVVASLQRATVANIVGEEAVGLAIEHGFVEEANVLEVGRTRHAQVLSLR